MKLPRDAYAGIFLGKITKWNDPKIAEANPGAKLPDRNINVIVRADASGTTFVFTKHLSTISEEFAKSPGTNKLPNWPMRSPSRRATTASPPASARRPARSATSSTAIAKAAKAKMAQLQNKAGKISSRPPPSQEQAALASVESAREPDRLGIRSGRRRFLSDRHLHLDHLLQELCRCKKAEALRDVLAWCVTEGQKESEASGVYSAARQRGDCASKTLR